MLSDQMRRATDNLEQPRKSYFQLGIKTGFEKTNSGFYFLIEETHLFPSVLEQQETYEQQKQRIPETKKSHHLFQSQSRKSCIHKAASPHPSTEHFKDRGTKIHLI